MNIPLNIHRDSADAMKTILDLHFPCGSILDVNHSYGVFYKKVNRDVTGIDIRSLSSIVADNRHLPFMENSFDIGVCDPPYKRGNGDPKYLDRYGAAPRTAQQSFKQYQELLPELLRVSRSGMIVKAQDETDGHRFYHRMFALVGYIKELTGLEPHDIFYVVKRGVPDNNIKGRERHFSANCLSYFLVYRWASKFPFKPIRH